MPWNVIVHYFPGGLERGLNEVARRRNVSQTFSEVAQQEICFRSLIIRTCFMHQCECDLLFKMKMVTDILGGFF